MNPEKKYYNLLLLQLRDIQLNQLIHGNTFSYKLGVIKDVDEIISEPIQLGLLNKLESDGVLKSKVEIELIDDYDLYDRHYQYEKEVEGVRTISVYPTRIERQLKTYGNRFTKNTELDVQAGSLKVRFDGLVYFEGSQIKMRKQLAYICRILVAQAPNKASYAQLWEAANGSKPYSKITLQKYINELRTILTPLLGPKCVSHITDYGYKLQI